MFEGLIFILIFILNSDRIIKYLLKQLITFKIAYSYYFLLINSLIKLN